MREIKPITKYLKACSLNIGPLEEIIFDKPIIVKK